MRSSVDERHPFFLSTQIILSLAFLACLPWVRGTWASPGSEEVRFSDGRSALKIPFEEEDGNLLIQVRINHSEPLWFLLDTGSNFVLDAHRAEVLGLHFESGRQVLGMGGSTEGSVVKGLSIGLPGVDLVNQSAVAFPLDEFSSVIGREVSGILGYELFSRFIVRIDYETRLIDLFDPRTDRLPDDGKSLPITLHRQYVPSIGAAVILAGRGPIQGHFVVDTGFNSSLALMKSFVVRNELMKSVGPTQRAHGEGVQEIPTSLGRVDGLQIGPFTCRNPVTSFGTADEAVLLGQDGLIGGRLLSRFHVVFDYPHGRIFLNPNKLFSEPDEFDMSGTALKAEGADYKIVRIQRILDPSPASEAGLRAGDVIVSIDGRPSADLSLKEISRMFQREGREYVLEIKRGRKTLKVKIKLRRLV